MLDTEFGNWIGRTEQCHGAFSSEAARKLSATVGGTAAKTGAPIPYLAHWCAFTPDTPMAGLAKDGHPSLGGFLPPIQLPRRMWAGGALEFYAPLHVGAEISRHSTIAAVAQKDGAAGPMVFVTVTHELREGNTLAIRETQDIVYLDIPAEFSPPRTKPTPTTPDLIEAVEVNEALLFRFSALTFNAHRIHYDLPYAQNVEKYPGLVVHGPLQAMLLMQAATSFAKRAPRKFSFRSVHPMFHFDDIHLFGTETADGMTLCIGLVDGHQGMQAEITWEDTL
ncbi:FAS1-like dehydratase domain-containing protein [Roseobacter litoralis]|uniref:FAS1-like dehydratase domain-containing protein n=1 Tax=Roseobacter litoralis TaxID=42443 RepID=UPI0024941214|nr:MaoC family dehydratase N-terminal domain-containing protein [Roseobacter litoralis]